MEYRRDLGRAQINFKSGTALTIATSDDSDIVFNVLDSKGSDIGSLSSGDFVVSKQGIYHISGQIKASVDASYGANEDITVKVIRNGATDYEPDQLYSAAYDAAAGAHAAFNITVQGGVWRLEKDDVISVNIGNASATSFVVAGAEFHIVQLDVL